MNLIKYGQPTRNSVLSCRLTKDEHNKLRQMAKDSKKSQADFIVWLMNNVNKQKKKTRNKPKIEISPNGLL